jgi:hypothetical protein
MTLFAVPENLAFDNYNDLVSAIGDWMDRSDLTGSAQTMIALAESRMRRALNPYWLEKSSSRTITEGVGSIPNDFGTLIAVRYADLRTLPQYSVEQALQIIPSGTEPYGFTIEGNALRLWPPSDCTVTLVYRPMLDQLSESNPSNQLLAEHPDVYFFGAMMFAEGYLANDSRAALFKSLFDEALGEVKRYLARQSFAGPLVPRLNVYP